ARVVDANGCHAPIGCSTIDQYDWSEFLDEVVQDEVVHAGRDQYECIALLAGLTRDRRLPLRRWCFGYQYAVPLRLGCPGETSQNRLEHRVAEIGHDEGD